MKNLQSKYPDQDLSLYQDFIESLNMELLEFHIDETCSILYLDNEKGHYSKDKLQELANNFWDEKVEILNICSTRFILIFEF